ncbi:restriction endonuclease subunit S [Gluconobacter cerinus]|uniref:restriction endonuclease subunit S n=1 Tax=Gluconobacter cerinus TaxID=38307 RepID=UPI0030B55C8A
MMFFKKVTTQELIADKFLEIGDGYRAKNSEMAATGIPFIRAGDVDGTVRISGTDYLCDASARTVSRKRSLPGDVVITTKGTIGRLAFVHRNSPEFIYSPQICFWRSLDLSVIDSRWLFFAMQSPFMREQMEWSAAQTDMAPYISLLDQRTAFSLLLPPINTQRSIASILGALDDKIDLNRRTNETLEAMARALFRDWFVDFGPTRAKMAGQTPYLAPEIWELFPDRLDDEGKPEGWTSSTVGQEVDVVGGSTPSTKNPAFWSGEIFWATPKDLSSLRNPVLLETERKITEEGLSQISSGLLPVGTVLLSSRAPIGYTAITQVPVAINQGFIAMVCQKRLSNTFIWLWTLANMETIHQKANGSTFQEISKANFRPIETIVPSSDVLRVFDEKAGFWLEKIVSNETESRTLAQLRDLLLPKLMSGEIRIRDAEKMLADAL